MGESRSGHGRPLVRAAMLCGLIASGLSAGSPAAPDPTAIIRDAVKTLAMERAGLIAFHQHYDYDEYGPAHHKTLVEDSGRLLKDGTLVEVRLYSHVANGSAASAADLARLQADLDKQLPPDDYVLPLSDAAIAEYRFEMASCNGCAAGSVAVTFTSLKRDPDHGDGTVVLDEATHHVLRLDFHPSALPKDADSGTIAMTFGRVLPDLWDLVKTESHYTGHVFFMHGGADIAVTDSAYRRYSSMDEARRALAAGI